MFYEIREQNGHFKLFFHKKDGFKFKKLFPKREYAEEYAHAYLQ